MVSGALGVLAAVAALLLLRASLPELDGERRLAGLDAPVSVQRDALGVVTIKAETSEDLARATGFVHAQERYFQMDLLRRSAAGEVAALVGSAAVDYDIARRRHGLRDVAATIFARLPETERGWLHAYAEGANAGLDALDARPFEYGLLRVAPQPWRPEDSLLTVFAMYFDLHDEDASRERFLAALHAHFPAGFADFLVPAGTPWDAPVTGEHLGIDAMPGSDVIDFRNRQQPEANGESAEALLPGSNNWAVDGLRSSSGVPIVANDMHLGLGVPNTWFRMRLELAGAGGFAVTGVSLPGVPAIAVGSNGHVAWSFTNSYGDWIDLVRLDTAGCEEGYRSVRGCETFERIETVIDVAHAESVTHEILRTRWGPVIESPANGGNVLYALRWTAHDPEATNLALHELARVRNVSDALEVAQRAGIPPQNFVVADAQGSIAWSIIGRIPRRAGHNGRLPLDSTQVDDVWQGWLAPEEYPLVMNPEHGRLWTANARVVDGEAFEHLGDGGYALGARAAQIRDRLFEQDRFDEGDMLRIQLDDEARFLSRWRELLDELLDAEAVAEKPERAELQAALAKWEGRASVDAITYRMVRGFRDEVFSRVFDGLTAEVKAVFHDFGFGVFSQAEGPLWELVTERPVHLLPPGNVNWRELLLTAADAVQQEIGAGEAFTNRTWGERNVSSIRHPLGGLPVIGLLLNATSRPLPGDTHMPRVQGKSFGASERFAVSPGREEDGYFHMPGGQSGHPLSPFYLAGHADWEEGATTPFLPGTPQFELKLLPVEQ